MPVTVQRVPEDELEARIQEAKDHGERILALSPAEIRKRGRVAKDFDVVSYTLVTQ